MELRHLRYFTAVAETLSFTQAAAECGVAQSALSQQIARLEKDVGAELFTRSSRQVRLTEPGAVLLPWARRLLADAEQAQQDIDALAGLRRGRLRLGVIQTVNSAVDLAATARRLSRTSPRHRAVRLVRHERGAARGRPRRRTRPRAHRTRRGADPARSRAPRPGRGPARRGRRRAPSARRTAARRSRRAGGRRVHLVQQGHRAAFGGRGGLRPGGSDARSAPRGRAGRRDGTDGHARARRRRRPRLGRGGPRRRRDRGAPAGVLRLTDPEAVHRVAVVHRADRLSAAAATLLASMGSASDRQHRSNPYH